MKPLGMTPTFQIVQAHPAQDKLWEAVELYIDNGGTPESFRREAAEAWAHYLAENAKHAQEVLRK
jgi:hypothetical protein